MPAPSSAFHPFDWRFSRKSRLILNSILKLRLVPFRCYSSPVIFLFIPVSILHLPVYLQIPWNLNFGWRNHPYLSMTIPVLSLKVPHARKALLLLSKLLWGFTSFSKVSQVTNHASFIPSTKSFVQQNVTRHRTPPKPHTHRV